MDTSKLRPDTARLWTRLDGEPSLHGFVLIGGTALALRIGHRQSEDLDFAYLGGLLPRRLLAAFVTKLGKEGMPFQLNQDVAADQAFINSGLDLMEHQQDYIANQSVKVSFARFDNGTTALLAGGLASPLRVATLDEIFRLKALVTAERSKTRDWFDLYVLMTQYGYGARDFFQAFHLANKAQNFDVAGGRLRACVPLATDEGYSHLLAAAPSLAEMRRYFCHMLDQIEVEVSKEAFRQLRS